MKIDVVEILHPGLGLLRVGLAHLLGLHRGRVREPGGDEGSFVRLQRCLRFGRACPGVGCGGASAPGALAHTGS